MVEPTIPAVFRFDGDCFALFPTLEATRDGLCTCYQHIGQHCAADYAGCIARSKPATPEQYADLLRELTRIGYRLRVVRRRPRR